MLANILKPVKSTLKSCTRLHGAIRSVATCELPETHIMLKQTCQEFANKELIPNAAEWDKKSELPKNIMKQLGDLGLLSIAIPEARGGTGLDKLAYAVAMEEVSRGCASTGVLMSVNNSLFLYPMSRHATPTQWQRLVDAGYMTGGKVGCFALSEPGNGSDAGAASTKAVPLGGGGDSKTGDATAGWSLSGTKSWITNAYEASAALVFATTDKSKKHRGISCFLIDVPCQGLQLGTREDKMGIRASSTAELQMAECGPAQLIGEAGQGFRIAMETLDSGRIGVAAQAIGIGQRALEVAVEYTGQREVFGERLWRQQAIQMKLAEMELRLQSARALTWNAARLADAHRPFSTESALAKLAASEAATFVTHQAVQILGAMGYMRATGLERLCRDARVTEIYEGTSEVQRIVIARSVLQRHGIGAK